MPRRLSLLAVAVVAALLAPSAAAAAPPEGYFGSNIQALIRQGFIPQARWGGYLEAAAGSGLRVARFDAPWAWAQPRRPPPVGPPAYDWSALDRVAGALAAHGIRWLPVIDFPPDWVHAGENELPASRYADFGAYARAFAARYGASGTFWDARPELPRLPVQHVEFWTEANSSHFWTGGPPDAAEYLGAFTAVRQGVKDADPSIGVIISLGWQDFESYMSALYSVGARGQTDGVGFHPYAPTARGVAVLTRRLREVLDANGEPDLPIYLTEIGWPRAPDGTGALRAFQGPVSDAARAATTALTADALAASDCGVANFIFYSLVEPQRDPGHLEDWLGLLNADGTPTATLEALSAATHRSSARAAQAAGPAGAQLPLCKGAPISRQTASSTLQPNGQMPVQLSIPMPASARCMAIQARYYGDPLEDVSVTLRQYRGKQTAAVTNAAGQTQLCLSAASRRKPFLAWGRTGGLASSPLLYCKGARCFQTSCRSLSLRLSRKALSATRLRLTVRPRCGRRTLFAEPIRVTALDAAGRPRIIREFFSAVGGDTFVVALKPRDRALRVRFKGDPTFQLAARERTLALRPAAGRRAAPARPAGR